MESIKYPGGLHGFTEKNKGFFIAALTDEYIVDSTDHMSEHALDKKSGKLLEIRVFNEMAEYRLFRGDIGSDFYERILSDDDAGDTFDEVQYLDIDDSVDLLGGMVQSTGGGKYHLPFDKKKNAGIRIRYYLDRYETTGQARIRDWRAVEFVEGQ